MGIQTHKFKLWTENQNYQLKMPLLMLQIISPSSLDFEKYFFLVFCWNKRCIKKQQEE